MQHVIHSLYTNFTFGYIRGHLLDSFTARNWRRALFYHGKPLLFLFSLARDGNGSQSITLVQAKISIWIDIKFSTDSVLTTIGWIIIKFLLLLTII